MLHGSALANRVQGSRKPAEHIWKECKWCRGKKSRIAECREVNRECVQMRKGKKSRGTGVGTCPKEAGGAPLSPRALASMAESVLMAAVPRLSTATIASDRGDSSGSRVADRMGHLAMPGTTAVPEIPSVMTAAKAWRRAMEAMLHMEMLLLLMAPAVPASAFTLPMLPRPALANWHAALRLMRASRRGPSCAPLASSCGGVASRLCSMSTLCV